MVFLGGDLFHDNKPSRKAMYQVMRSIRLNCLGEKPCELQVLGDQSIIFDDKSALLIPFPFLIYLQNRVVNEPIQDDIPC